MVLPQGKHEGPVTSTSSYSRTIICRWFCKPPPPSTYNPRTGNKSAMSPPPAHQHPPLRPHISPDRPAEPLSPWSVHGRNSAGTNPFQSVTKLAVRNGPPNRLPSLHLTNNITTCSVTFSRGSRFGRTLHRWRLVREVCPPTGRIVGCVHETPARRRAQAAMGRDRGVKRVHVVGSGGMS